MISFNRKERYGQMSVGCSRVWSYFILTACTIIFGVSACGGANSGPVPVAITTPVFDMPSAMPDLTTTAVTRIKVEPDLRDDYLSNPGIGWQIGSATSSSLGLPEAVTYANRRDIAWSVLNPAENVYDWSVLDGLLRDAIAEGKQFSFRVYTMVGEGYGGHMVPDWVLEKGAIILPTGEPDYSSCVYQEEWGKFVNELGGLYDGNRDIAFIDISGYGNFNEWSWQDHQTEWDSAWESGYLGNSVSPDLFTTLDGQARRRLADMFIGGSFENHKCLLANGETAVVNYSYRGFQKSQLVMPYAGIVQASQYVFSRRNDVGVRYDCLGRNGERLMEKIGDVILSVWTTAPVIFEFCKPDQFDVDDARLLLQNGHGSIVHDNTWRYGSETLKDLLRNVGYRYFLKEVTLQVEGRAIALQMDWQNVGSAPNYPKMGQEFQLYFRLMDSTGAFVHKELVPANISKWLPSDPSADLDQVYAIAHGIQLPLHFPAGGYFAAVSIVDMRTGEPISLAFGDRDQDGWYLLTPIEIR